MASFKVSQFTGVTNSTDDSLLMLSYTTDSGSTFATRKIRVADFLDDIAATTKADVGVDHLETLTGAGADAEDLGTFTGTTIADSSTIKAALQALETSLELKGASSDVYLLDGSQALTADFDAGSYKLTNVADPSANTDAATKGYVDSVAQGLTTKEPVRLATAAALPAVTYNNGTSGVGATLTADAVGALTVDGVAPGAGDRILVKDQVLQEHNGIYYLSTVGDGSTAFVLTRVVDLDSAEAFPSSFVFVSEGSTNADQGYVCTTDATVTVGTTDIVYAQFSGAGQVTAGTGLTKTGNTLNANGTTDRISVSADAIDIASTYVGQTSITTLGTIATGTWQGTAIDGTYIANDTIDSQHYAAGSIDTEHLGALQVTDAKINDVAHTKITVAAPTTDTIGANSYLFLVVDSSGDIKLMDKTFIEQE